MGYPTTSRNSRSASLEKRVARDTFAQKLDRRARLAGLPFEKKIEILIELQKMAAGIRKDPPRIIWPSR
ncbi:hypothetical protein D4R89_03990 [bacterium]|nr:MAG: hypothetical protein D4R89_03990 [bacterium]